MSALHALKTNQVNEPHVCVWGEVTGELMLGVQRRVSRGWLGLIGWGPNLRCLPGLHAGVVVLKCAGCPRDEVERRAVRPDLLFG